MGEATGHTSPLPCLAGEDLHSPVTEAKLGCGQQQEQHINPSGGFTAWQSQKHLPEKPREHRVKMLFLCLNNSRYFALKHLSGDVQNTF